VVKFVKN